jgi:hypothetical protein
MILHKYRSNGVVSGECAAHKLLLIILSLNNFLKAFSNVLAVRAVTESWEFYILAFFICYWLLEKRAEAFQNELYP